MVTSIKWWLNDDIKIVDTGKRLVALDGWNGMFYANCFEVNDVLDNYAYGVGEGNLCVKQEDDGRYEIIDTL